MKQLSVKWKNEESWVRVLAILIAMISVVSSRYSNQPEFGKHYCRIRPNGKCCEGRDDPCSVPIDNTQCYCDHFCNREVNPDCCPDYWDVCLGDKPQADPARVCDFKHLSIPLNVKIMDNCNECQCTKEGLNCEKDECLVDTDILTKLQHNSNVLGWTATNYSQFWGKKLDDGFLKLTGTFQPDLQTFRMYPIDLDYVAAQLPRAFDARQKWQYVGRVKDQGWCAASWAFSTVSVVEDRLAIASHGNQVMNLSMQNLLSCNRRGKQACAGGYIERAWFSLRNKGLVTEECYPYESGIKGNAEDCKIDTDAFLQNPECRGDQNGHPTRYKTEPAYRIASKEGDIMWEIMNNGPVQALMRVDQDFFFYKSGTYVASNIGYSMPNSTHSVELLGWGEETLMGGPPIKYWLAANSWGENWGDGGTFKIRRGTNELGIEDFILAVRPKLPKRAVRVAHLKKHQTGGRRNALWKF